MGGTRLGRRVGASRHSGLPGRSALPTFPSSGPGWAGDRCPAKPACHPLPSPGLSLRVGRPGWGRPAGTQVGVAPGTPHAKRGLLSPHLQGSPSSGPGLPASPGEQLGVQQRQPGAGGAARNIWLGQSLSVQLLPARSSPEACTPTSGGPLWGLGWGWEAELARGRGELLLGSLSWVDEDESRGGGTHSWPYCQQAWSPPSPPHPPAAWPGPPTGPMKEDSVPGGLSWEGVGAGAAELPTEATRGLLCHLGGAMGAAGTHTRAGSPPGRPLGQNHAPPAATSHWAWPAPGGPGLRMPSTPCQRSPAASCILPAAPLSPSSPLRSQDSLVLLGVSRSCDHICLRDRGPTSTHPPRVSSEVLGPQLHPSCDACQGPAVSSQTPSAPPSSPGLSFLGG